MKKHKAEQKVQKKKQTDQICPCPQKFANYAPSKYTTFGTTELNSKCKKSAFQTNFTNRKAYLQLILARPMKSQKI